MSFLSFMNSTAGRAIRVVLGLALVVLGVLVGGGLGIAIAVFALLPMATGIFGICPVNPILGQPLRACAVPAHGRRHR
jgi:hypothetical protein